MQSIKSAKFNQDTLNLEVEFSDGKRTYIPIVPLEDSLELNIVMQSKFDWLLYNSPLSFATLHFSDELLSYLELVSDSYNQTKGSIIKTEDCTISKASQVAVELLFYEN